MHDVELRPLRWAGDASHGHLELLEQRALPAREEWLACRSVPEVATAIRDMTVRGAPAIGLAAAYGLVLAAASAKGDRLAAVRDARAVLAKTRPTAVNLFWALEQMEAAATRDASPEQLLEVARALHDEDVRGNRRIGEDGAALIEDGMGVLTHCNAGSLATGGLGTALAPLFIAHRQQKKFHVFVDETRPRLQGARLTAWELDRAGVPFTLICDNMAASLMRKGRIQLCVVGADRIAANGDVANKVGTYSVAVNAAHHRARFVVAAPRSTFDLSLATGDAIPIEERDTREVTDWGAERTCPPGIHVYNPGFDVTPAALVDRILTDRGVIAPVDAATVRRIVG
ncbi:MAG: S-methyl-5-thioribose-1-phosphate isomerase [Myxococcota bacterium]